MNIKYSIVYDIETNAHSNPLSKNKIYLEVNTNNFAAKSFYYNLGFEEVGIRKRYYNKDDAILMDLRA